MAQWLDAGIFKAFCRRHIDNSMMDIDFILDSGISQMRMIVFDFAQKLDIPICAHYLYLLLWFRLRSWRYWTVQWSFQVPSKTSRPKTSSFRADCMLHTEAWTGKQVRYLSNPDEMVRAVPAFSSSLAAYQYHKCSLQQCPPRQHRTIHLI